MMRSLFALVCTFVAAAPVAAQTSARTMPAELRDGRWAMSFGVTLEGASVGYSNMTSARNAFTLDLNGFANLATRREERADSSVFDNDQASFSVVVAPGFRRYLSGRGEAASFVAARLILGVDGFLYEVEGTGPYYSRSISWGPTAGVGGGFGIEWFVTDNLSLRGEANLSARYSYHDLEHARTGSGVEEGYEHRLQANLDFSGVSATLWF